MDRTERYILMYQNNEVCSFDAVFGDRNAIRIVDRLKDFDKAPFGVGDKSDADTMNMALFRFFNGKTIASMRRDCETILKYTGTKSPFELSFKGHGLSLSNHYWFRKEDENLKYEDINFFTNKWDDSFARAVLSGNYEKLSHVDLNVPDIVTAGWGVKGWLIGEDGPRLYKLGIHEGHCEEALAEVLCSKLAQRMFKNNEFWEYRLEKVYGKYASVSKVIIGVDEELVPLSVIVPEELYSLYRQRSSDKIAADKFLERLSDVALPGAKEFFEKLAVWRSLCFVNDMHFDNLCAIRNIKTGQIRMAPAFDFGSAYGSGETGRKILSDINKGTYILIYFAFGDIKPEWDYSWYDPNSLDGFEDDIRETLSISDFYTPQLIDNIIDVYHHQKASLDEFAKSQRNK